MHDVAGQTTARKSCCGDEKGEETQIQKKPRKNFIKCHGCREKMRATPLPNGRGHLCSYCPACINKMEITKKKIREAARRKAYIRNHTRREIFDKPRIVIYLQRGRFGQRHR